MFRLTYVINKFVWFYFVVLVVFFVAVYHQFGLKMLILVSKIIYVFKINIDTINHPILRQK